MTREPPDVDALLAVLDRHDVRYVVTGSSAALLLGVVLRPGDLDVTPALDRENLDRLARALAELEASLDPAEPFGRWETIDGEHTWVAFEPTDADREARTRWRPDPAVRESFDHLLRTSHGALDVVPTIAGTFDELRARAVAVGGAGGRVTWVESIAYQLATLTVPRREKDADRVRDLRALQRAPRIAGGHGDDGLGGTAAADKAQPPS
jgi:hypothetical protein